GTYGAGGDHGPVSLGVPPLEPAVAVASKRLVRDVEITCDIDRQGRGKADLAGGIAGERQGEPVSLGIALLDATAAALVGDIETARGIHRQGGRKEHLAGCVTGGCHGEPVVPGIPLANP